MNYGSLRVKQLDIASGIQSEMKPLYKVGVYAIYIHKNLYLLIKEMLRSFAFFNHKSYYEKLFNVFS